MCHRPPGVALTQINSATTSTSLPLNLRPVAASYMWPLCLRVRFLESAGGSCQRSDNARGGHPALSITRPPAFCNLIFVMSKNVRQHFAGIREPRWMDVLPMDQSPAGGGMSCCLIVRLVENVRARRRSQGDDMSLRVVSSSRCTTTGVVGSTFARLRTSGPCSGQRRGSRTLDVCSRLSRWHSSSMRRRSAWASCKLMA